MKVAVIGATGNTGSRITAKLRKRGHHVRAVVRSLDKIHSTEGLEVASSDLSDVAQLANALKGADAVVSAYRPPDNDTDQIIGTTKRITDAVKANKQRLLVVEAANRKRRVVACGLDLSLTNKGAAVKVYLPLTPVGNMHSTRSSCAVIHCGVPTVVIKEK